MTEHDLTSLAFSMYHNKGVYALLLGSGISRGANIPTAWDIVEDLCRQIAVANGENIDEINDFLNWYEVTYEEPPGYSTLLAKLGRTQADRTGALRKYFEESADDGVALSANTK